MAAAPFNDARDILQRAVTNRLRKVPTSRKLPSEELQTLGHEAIAVLFEDEVTVKAMVEFLSSQGVLEPTKSHERDWMKTDDIARLLGYSAPYVRALLDNEPYFQPRVIKTSGGQRRVRAEDVREWIKLKGVRTSEERSKLPDYERETPDYFSESRETEAPLLSERQRKARLESVRHRPAKPKAK